MEPQPEAAASTKTPPRPMSTRATSGGDFQAVILAIGTEASLSPLTSPQLPKALLPVANRPLLLSHLKMLERAGITSVIVVATASAASGIQEVATAFTTSTVMDIKVEVCDDIDDPGNGGAAGTGADSTSVLGTADALRQVKDQISGDCVVLGCDLVTDQPLDTVLDVHRVHQVCRCQPAAKTRRAQGSPAALMQLG